MTYGEIIDVLRANSNKHISDLKEKAVFDYTLATLIGKHIGALLSKDEVVPSLFDVYEVLFQEEKKNQDEVKAKNDLEIWKQKMINFTEHHNREWGENR